MGLIDYETHISEILQDPEVLQEYLNQALKEDDVRVFLIILGDIIKATPGGLAGVAKKTGYSRQTLYKTLSEKGNPTWTHLQKFISAAGFRLQVEPIEKKERTIANKKTRKRKLATA